MISATHQLAIVVVVFICSLLHRGNAVPLDPEFIQDAYTEPYIYTGERDTARVLERSPTVAEPLPPPPPRRRRRSRRKERFDHDFRTPVHMIPQTDSLSEPGHYRREPVYARPEPVYARPEPVYARPESDYARPESVYARPDSVYARPEPVYSRPESAYSRSEPTYVRPIKRSRPQTIPQTAVRTAISTNEHKYYISDNKVPGLDKPVDKDQDTSQEAGKDKSNGTGKDDGKDSSMGSEVDPILSRKSNRTGKLERSDKWTPRQQDSIIGSWFRAIGSLFSSPKNGTTKTTPSPSISPSNGEVELKSLTEDTLSETSDKNMREPSTSIIHTPNERTPLAPMAPVPPREDLSADRQANRVEAQSAGIQRPRQSRGSWHPHTRDAENIDTADDTEPNLEDTDTDHERQQHHYSGRANRARQRPTRNKASAFLVGKANDEMQDLLVAHKVNEYDGEHEKVHESGKAHEMTENDDALEPVSDDPLSKTETREMVLLFKRLFTTLEGVLNDQSDVRKRFNSHETSLPDVRLSIQQVENMNRQREADRRAGLSNIHYGKEKGVSGIHGDGFDGDRVESDHDPVIKLADEDHGGSDDRRASRDSMSSKDDEVDATDSDEALQGIPRSAPSYGARKKLQQVKSGVIGGMYDSLASGINAML